MGFNQPLIRLEADDLIIDTIQEVQEVIGLENMFDAAPLYLIGELAKIPGDYIEIGTWFGASALVVGTVRKKLGISGSITCVDLFTRKNPSLYRLHSRENLPTPEIVYDSAKQMGIELEIVVSPSFPFPKELYHRTFAIGYVDGDHRYPHPSNDLGSLANRVTRYIAVDDYAPNGRPIQLAVLDLLKHDPAWDIEIKISDFMVLGRPNRKRTLVHNVTEWLDPEFPWDLISS